MRYCIFCMILILSTVSSAYAVNHMDLINTLYGEFNGAYFGAKIVSMDYNADGYDDLIVNSPWWNPSGTYNSDQYWGKIYFFWGGPDMDNLPDFIMEGASNWEFYENHMINGGDINGDGMDDLVISLYVDTYWALAVYYATSNPTGIPDLTIPIPYELSVECTAKPLGDINGDDCADLLIITDPFATSSRKLIIWTGNDDPFVSIVQTTNGSASAIGIGDVNNDEVDDYLLQYGIPGGTNMNSRIVLYYGSTSFPEVDSLVISENTNNVIGYSASPLGDLNSDGYADFASYADKVWFGRTDLSIINDFDLIVNYPYHEWYSSSRNIGTPFIHGDLNGDGYDDVIGSTDQYGYYDGEVGIWIGGPNMDGIIDLRLYPLMTIQLGITEGQKPQEILMVMDYVTLLYLLLHTTAHHNGQKEGCLSILEIQL